MSIFFYIITTEKNKSLCHVFLSQLWKN